MRQESMLQHGNLQGYDPQPVIATDAASGRGLAKVVYRSRAVQALSPAALHELTRAAQGRNGREAITGVMLYDNERFFQWLEGPAPGVARVMDSIVADSRHTDIEILDRRPADARLFGDWSMKLATSAPAMTPWRRDVIEPPREVVDALRAQPGAAPSVLVRLVGLTGAASAAEADPALNLKLSGKTAAVLRKVFLSSIVPYLGGSAEAAPTNHRAVELAELLVATDAQASADLIEELAGSGRRIGPLSANLFEPTARQLGDLWSEDFCSEFDVTIGLCRLQTAVRLLEATAPQPRPSGRPRPSVLIAPEPGERHRLGAALDGTVLRSAGWLPQCEYPADDHALQDMLAATWFDVLDLSLSAAFRRDHALPKIAKTIAGARHASRNPGLLVVVGGRVFVEERVAGASVGADHANTTAKDVNRSILNTLSATRTRTGAVSEQPQVLATPS